MQHSNHTPSINPPTHQKNQVTEHTVFWLVLIAIVLLAANMRSPIVALGSIAPVIQEVLNISDTHIGWLGAAPMLMFALGSLISPAIGKRFGLENTLIFALIALTAGIFIRSWWVGWTGFLLGTVLLSLAIGFTNTLAAPIIKQRTPNHIPLITGLYSLSMTVMAGLVAGIVYPLAEVVGWQWALGGWAALGILAIAFWVMLRVKLGSSHQLPQTMTTQTQHDESIAIWQAPLAWYLAIFMGLQSLLYYTVASFLPSIWMAKGLTQTQGGNMGSVFQFMAPVAIISLTWLIRRGTSVRTVAAAAGLCNVVGTVGIAYLSPALAGVWTALIGLGCSSIFTLSIMLFSMRTYTPNQASRLSGMVQTVAYLIAFFGPLGTGWLYDITHSWDVPLLIMIILMLINAAMAWLASRPTMIDGRPAQ